MIRIAVSLIALIGLSSLSIAQEEEGYPKSHTSYSDFKSLVKEVESHREERLIDLNTFLAMSKEKEVVILDTRSDFRYKRKHLKGAIHLAFSDFTQDSLNKLIPDPDTIILIYCNNNFEGDQIDFMTKAFVPIETADVLEEKLPSGNDTLLLALNIPTYINLYGYGYSNVYELNELVNVNDPRIEFEGTDIRGDL